MTYPTPKQFHSYIKYLFEISSWFTADYDKSKNDVTYFLKNLAITVNSIWLETCRIHLAAIYIIKESATVMLQWEKH